jgi:hypothetical protein
MNARPLQALAEGFLAQYGKHALDTVRERAAARFRAEGLPTPAVEAWHYTPLHALAEAPFATPAGDPADLIGELPDLGVPDCPPRPPASASAPGSPPGVTFRIENFGISSR